MTKIGLFASIHNIELMKQLNFNDEVVEGLFNNFKPDVIAGEVRKKDYCKNKKYQGPSEYKRFIFNYAKEKCITFYPCDEYDNKTKRFNKKMENTILSREKEEEYNDILDEYMKAGRESTIPFNSFEFNETVRRKQAFQMNLNKKAQEVIWNRRNDAIIKNIKEIIEKEKNKNILVVFGAEHIYYLYDELKKIEDIEIVFPLS